MSTKSEQMYDELLVEYADENLQVNIDSDLLSELKINKATLTRFANKWINQNKAKWVRTNTLQLIIKDDDLQNEDNEVDAPETENVIEKKDSNNNQPYEDTETSMTLPYNYVSVIIDMVEFKFGVKLTKEIQLIISKNVKNIETWEKIVKNILSKTVPDKVIKDYLDYVIED